jgi:putative transposase
MRDLTLADRVYRCPDCGLEIDRDLNAAVNLAALGEGPNGPGLPGELGCSNASP